MKWSPQPKDKCARADCDKAARQWGFCINHSILWRRNGVPYTQQEVAEMHEANRHSQEMDAALEANPPRIRWRKDKHGIMRAVSIQDPHAETTTAAQARRLRLAADQAEREIAAEQVERIRRESVQLMQEEASEVAERFRQHRADNTPLMAAARTEI